MISQEYVHGFRVRYEDPARDGVYHLKLKIDKPEAEVFFNQAREKELAHFEDQYDRDYVIAYSRSDNFYYVIRTVER